MFSLKNIKPSSSVRTIVKLFELSFMNECRKAKVVLLDGRKIDITIQPKLYAHELLDMVLQSFNIKEKQYFGLCYMDDSNTCVWLQFDKYVLEHEFARKIGHLIFYLTIKYFVDSVNQISDPKTLQMYYYYCKYSIFKGTLICDIENTFSLTAYFLQIEYGDFVDELMTRRNMKKCQQFHTHCVDKSLSILAWEIEVIQRYKQLSGMMNVEAVIKFVDSCINLPNYGLHYFEIKDKNNLQWWIGISLRGISLYDQQDKKLPRKVFVWKILENLYYRDRKFSIEVQDPRKNSSRFGDGLFSTSNINVHSWIASSIIHAKNIWLMAVDQHQYYLDSRKIRAGKTINTEIDNDDLEISISSLIHSNEKISTSNSSILSSQSGLKDTGNQCSIVVEALLQRKYLLESNLDFKLNQLNLLENQEEAILSNEKFNQNTCSENLKFKFDDNSIDVVFHFLEMLEKDLECQEKILINYHKLLRIFSSNQISDKQHLIVKYKGTLRKFRETEKRLNKYRRLAGKPLINISSKYIAFDEKSFIFSTKQPFNRQHLYRSSSGGYRSQKMPSISPFQSSSVTKLQGEEINTGIIKYYSSSVMNMNVLKATTLPYHISDSPFSLLDTCDNNLYNLAKHTACIYNSQSKVSSSNDNFSETQNMHKKLYNDSCTKHSCTILHNGCCVQHNCSKLSKGNCSLFKNNVSVNSDEEDSEKEQAIKRLNKISENIANKDNFDFSKKDNIQLGLLNRIPSYPRSSRTNSRRDLCYISSTPSTPTSPSWPRFSSPGSHHLSSNIVNKNFLNIEGVCLSPVEVEYSHCDDCTTNIVEFSKPLETDDVIKYTRDTFMKMDCIQRNCSTPSAKDCFRNDKVTSLEADDILYYGCMPAKRHRMPRIVGRRDELHKRSRSVAYKGHSPDCT